MWTFKMNFPLNCKNCWNCETKKSSSSPSNSDQCLRPNEESYSSEDRNEAEEKFQIPQSWQLLGIKGSSKSWKFLDNLDITEQDVKEKFQNISPENFEINGQFLDTGNTLLHEASIKGQPIVLKKLLTYNPDVNIQNKELETPIMSLVKECSKCEDKTDTCKKHLSCLKILMAANPNLSIKNKVRLTVLGYATMCSEKNREKYFKKLLHINEKKNLTTGLYKALESQLDVQFLEELDRVCEDNKLREKIQEFMFGKYTLLQSVCKYGMIESSKRLLELKADPYFAPIIPKKPIQLACIFSQPDILQLLIQADESLLRVKTKSGRNLFHSAVKNNSDFDNAHECLNILLKYKKQIDINETDNHGRTPLHYAVFHNRDECAVELLKNGAQIDCADKWKQTPLMRISKSVFEKYLDSMIKEDSGKNCNTDENKPGTSIVTIKKEETIIFDFSNLFQTAKLESSKMAQEKLIFRHVTSTEDLYAFPTDFLCKIKNTKQLETLIEHPVLSVIIYYKWLYVRAFFYLHFFLYLLFCLLFSLYIYLTEDNPFLRVVTPTNNSFQSRPLNIISTTINLIHVIDMRLYLIIPILSIISVFLIFESLKFIKEKRKYLLDLDNILRLSVIIFAIFVMVCLNTHLFSPYCPQLKAISILLTWLELFAVVGKYPDLSYYVSTFRSASLNLLKFLSVYAILLFGFALSFHTLFRSSIAENVFTSPFNAFFKTIVMLTAEFDASNIPFHEYSIVSHSIFILYIFTITIVLLNLMVAIAFKHAKKIMGKNRHLYVSLAQIDYIKHFEDNFSENFIIGMIYNWFSSSNCFIFSNHGSYNVTESAMGLKVSIRENDQEFDNKLIFETHPEGRVRIKTIPENQERDKKWYEDFKFFTICKTVHNLHPSVIENAQEIVSKRYSKKEESKKENLNSKAELEIVRNELIELRRFIQSCFEKKEKKKEEKHQTLKIQPK